MYVGRALLRGRARRERLAVGDELKQYRVDAIALAGRRRTVISCQRSAVVSAQNFAT